MLIAESHDTKNMPKRLVDVMNEIVDVVPVGFRVESIEGEIYVTPPAAPEHRSDIELLEDQLRAMGVGRVGTAKEFSAGSAPGDDSPRVIPDLFVQSRENSDMDLAWARAHDNYFPLSMVRLAVEVTSPSTRRIDLEVKTGVYAGSGVDVYLVVDRKQRVLLAHWEPDPPERVYKKLARYDFGDEVPLPAPFGKLRTDVLL